MKHGKTIYIAGPMSGIEEYNFPAFDMAEADLRAKGWNVINPAQMDRDIGFDPAIDVADAAFLHDAMIRDTEAIIHRADALAMLPGWENSKGAKGEMGLAIWKHIPVYQWPEMTEIKGSFALIPSEKEGSFSYKITEAEKAATLERSGLAPDKRLEGVLRDCLNHSTAEKRKQRPIASGVLDYFPDAIREIAHCSWVGNEQHNPGEPLHWSRGKSDDHADCLLRHFMERGTVDSDGVPHSIKVCWRALALAQLELEAAKE